MSTFLNVWGAQLPVVGPDRPGMVVTYQSDSGLVTVRPEGYSDLAERQKAMHEAMKACMRAGLQVALNEEAGFTTRKKVAR